MSKQPALLSVPLTEIDLGDRARKEYKNLPELITSIKEKELIHPIAVALHPSPNNGHKYILVAGGRRYRAHQEMGVEKIACRVYGKILTDLEYRSIELEENIQREDLTWQEKAMLEREIHMLQVAIHGEKIARAPDAPGHSMADTAALLGVSKAKVSQDVALANAMQQFPDAPWDKCKTASDAQKLKHRMEKTIVNDHLASQAQKTFGNANQMLQRMFDAYILQDAFEGLKGFPKEHFDIVELDPPYGIDLQNAKSKKGLGADGLMDYNEVDAKEYPKFLAKIIKECYRVMKPDSYLIFWFGPDPWFELIASILEQVGFRLPRIPGIWTKPNGQTNSPTTRLASAYEMFFYAAKGSPQIAKPGSKNVFPYDPVPHDKKRHPTQRPISLIKDLLEIFAKPNSRVLVPFLGSGATLEAAFLANMHPVGFDLGKTYRDKYILHVKEMYHELNTVSE